MTHLGIGTREEEEHEPRHRPWRGCLAVLVACAILAGIGTFAYVKGVDVIKHALSHFSGPADYSGTGHGSVVVQVRQGDTASDIGATLTKAQVVESEEAFVDAARNDSRSRDIQVGFYRLRRHMSAASALALLLQPGSMISHSVTIPEGKRADEILAAIVADTRLGKTAVDKAFADTKALGLPPYAKGHAEGYLFPATYDVTPGTTAASLLREMTAKFDAEASNLGLVKAAANLHRSPTDVVIVASLVQAEARRAVDMPKVARVIYNRLQIGMPLQLDSTLHYAVNSRGHIATSNNLRQLKSPYNSYTHTGLPPTAIDSPGAEALKAALHPAAGTWRFFVTVNLRTGKTLFATTFAQQQHNETIYHEYCQTSSAC